MFAFLGFQTKVPSRHLGDGGGADIIHKDLECCCSFNRMHTQFGIQLYCHKKYRGGSYSTVSSIVLMPHSSSEDAPKSYLPTDVRRQMEKHQVNDMGLLLNSHV